MKSDTDPEQAGMKFPLGQLVATKNAVAALLPEDIKTALRRHVTGDWGDLPEEDQTTNENALVRGDRLFSVYHSLIGVKFYVITEWDRSLTTVLLPEDY